MERCEKAVMLDALIETYRPYFDIEPDVVIGGEELAAACEFHSKTAKYVLSKKAQLWAAEMNEYAFVAVRGHLNAEAFDKLRESVLAEGLRRVKPHSEHMYSYVTLVVIADSADAEAASAAAKTRFRKRYRLLFHGWMEFRIAVLDCSTGAIHCNRAGKDVQKLLEQLRDKRLPEKQS